jgi:hypothetical protein
VAEEEEAEAAVAAAAAVDSHDADDAYCARGGRRKGSGHWRTRAIAPSHPHRTQKGVFGI